MRSYVNNGDNKIEIYFSEGDLDKILQGNPNRFRNVAFVSYDEREGKLWQKSLEFKITSKKNILSRLEFSKGDDDYLFVCNSIIINGLSSLSEVDGFYETNIWEEENRVYNIYLGVGRNSDGLQNVNLNYSL